jgi:hypothetical protein
VSLELVKKTESKFRNWIQAMPTVAVLLPIQGISLLYWWIAGSYLGLNVYSSRSFPAADGWCEAASEGLGSHCWGDYYYVIFLLFSQPNPWLEYANAYPAAALIPFMVTHLLGSITGFAQAGLLIYLGSMTLLIGLGVWVGTKGISMESRIILFSTITFLSPPLIHALDRGNNVGFIIPLLVWFFSALTRLSPNQGVLAVVLLTVIKPHFAVLLFLYLIRGELRTFTKGALLGVTIHVLAFLIVAGNRFPVNIYDWFSRFISYQDYTSVANGWPQNISFAQGLYSFATLVPSQFKNESDLQDLEGPQGLIGPLVLLSILCLITAYRRVLTDVQVGILLTSLVAMTSSTSWYYYAIFSIPALLALTQMSKNVTSSTSRAKKDENLTSKKINFILWVVLVLTLIQLPMYQLASDKSIIVTTANLVGGFWIIAYALIFSVLIRSKIVKIQEIRVNKQDFD